MFLSGPAEYGRGIMHIFLEGQSGAGKSSVIKKIIHTLNIKPGGFRSYFGPDRDSLPRYLYMQRADLEDSYGEDHAAAYFSSDGKVRAFSEKFTNSAHEYIEKTKKSSPLIVMDECSFLESGAPVFKNAVLRCLDEDIPVLGVVRRRENIWTSEIISHPAAAVFHVDEQNRDALCTLLCGYYSTLFSSGPSAAGVLLNELCRKYPDSLGNHNIFTVKRTDSAAAGRADSILLMRHCRPERLSDNSVYLGRTDPPLSEQGSAESLMLAERMKNTALSKVYTSSLKRAVQTAEAAGRILGVSVCVLDSLNEIDMGSWDGKKISEIKSLYPEEYKKRGENIMSFAAPGGESFAAAGERAGKAVDYIKNTEPGTVLVISHAGVIRSLLCLYGVLDEKNFFDFKIGYGGLIRLL